MTKYSNYYKTLINMGLCTEAGMQQFDIYFEMIKNQGLGKLTGEQMALVACLMLNQKHYGADEMYKALKS